MYTAILMRYGSALFARVRRLVCLGVSVLVHPAAWVGSVIGRLVDACEGPAHDLFSGELCLSDVIAVSEVVGLYTLAVNGFSAV